MTHEAHDPKPSLFSDCTVTLDREYIRCGGGSRRHLRVSLQAAAPPKDTARQPLRIAFVVDRSGSMRGTPLSLAGQAVCEAVALLEPVDSFALLTFDDACEVVLPTDAATEFRKAAARAACTTLSSGGSTNLAGAWALGCAQVAAAAAQGLARVLVLTDGQANVGETVPAKLCEHARALRRKGVATSCLGLGEGFNEALLGAMADAGGGRFYFAARPEELIEHMRAEVLEGLEVVARGVAVELRPLDGGRLSVLGGLSAEWTGTALRVELGDIVARQSLDVVFAVQFSTGEMGETRAFALTVVDAEGRPCAPAQTLRFTYAPGDVVDRQPRELSVDRRVARLYANEARLAAVALNRERRYDEAAATLLRVAEKVHARAGDDEELRAIERELREGAREFGRALKEHALKAAHSVAYFSSRSKTARGRSSIDKDET